MTTELIILMGLLAFVILGAFLGEDSSLRATFEGAAPHLGARVEKQLETGIGFQQKSREADIQLPVNWQSSKGVGGTFE